MSSRAATVTATAVIFAVTVLLNALQKPIFLLLYGEPEFGFGDWAAVVGHGLTLDCTVAGYITAIPIIAAIISMWLPSRFAAAAKYTVAAWLTFAAVLSALAFTANLALYEYWGFPLDASVLQFLATPREAAASVTAADALKAATAFAAWFAITEWCWIRILKMWRHDRNHDRRSATLWTLLLLFGAALDFLAIRGGVTESVANLSKAYFSNNTRLNHAAVNPLFSLLSSAAAQNRLDEYEFFDEESRNRIFEAAVGSPKSDDSEEEHPTLLRTDRPDILLILAESFGRSTVDECVGGTPVAPRFQALKADGIWFENMIANSFRTDRGTVAVLSAFPAQPRTSIMKMVAKARNLPSIASSLAEAGYSTSFVYGGDINFTNTAAYLYGTGFERLIWQRDMHPSAAPASWGYDDAVTADIVCETVLAQAAEGRRFFTVWQTLSSHEPFDVPFERFDDPMLNSMAFTDDCIGRVAERLRESDAWDNLLVIIIADHAFRYPYGIAAHDPMRHRIPMLWTGGAIARPAVIENFASQTDLAATLLAQLGLPRDRFIFSRDILDPSSDKFGYYCFNDGFGIVTAEGTTVWERNGNGEGRILSPAADSLQILRGKALLQTTFKTIREL